MVATDIFFPRREVESSVGAPRQIRDRQTSERKSRTHIDGVSPVTHKFNTGDKGGVHANPRLHAHIALMCEKVMSQLSTEDEITKKANQASPAIYSGRATMQPWDPAAAGAHSVRAARASERQGAESPRSERAHARHCALWRGHRP